MTRTSTFAVVTLAVIAATSLTSTAVFAHGGFSGGGFGGGIGGGFGGGHAGFATGISGGFSHGPVAASGIGRSTVISRMPTVGSNKATSIPSQSVVSRMPAPSSKASNIASQVPIARLPIGTGTGTSGAANPGGHSNIETTPAISQLPPVTPKPVIPDPLPTKPGTGPNFGGGVVPVVVPVPVGTPVVVAGSDVAAVGVDAQPAPAAQAAQPAQAVQPTCNCLTKRYLEDGSVLFQDICSREAALATPAQLKLQALRLNR
jgi:hypothetical protein